MCSIIRVTKKGGEEMEIKEANNLRRLRAVKGMTQQELGEKIGVTGKAIRHYEKGIRQPNLELAKKIADVFETTIEEIFDL